MRKRPFLTLGLFAAIAAAGFFAVIWLTAPTHRIDHRSFQQIADGMSQDNVEAILRAPPGIHAAGCLTGMYWLSWDPPHGDELIRKWGGKEWVGEDRSIYILFNEDGRVMFKAIGDTLLEDRTHASFRREGTVFGKIRRWLQSRS